MRKYKKLLDTSEELILQKHRNGIRLIRPDKFTGSSHHTVADVLAFPFNVYFLNPHSEIQNANALSADTLCGVSVEKILGNTAFQYTSEVCAKKLRMNDISVVTDDKIAVLEEDGEMLHKEKYFSALSVKSPWYDNNNNVVGIFGCSIVLNEQSLSGLSLVASLGLLDKKTVDNNNGLYSLSPRETDVLRLVVRGCTAKHIARVFSLSPRTVEQHLENIKIKVAVSTKAELIEKVIDHFI